MSTSAPLTTEMNESKTLPPKQNWRPYKQTSTIKARNAEQKLGKRRSLETPLTTEYFCFLFFFVGGAL